MGPEAGATHSTRGPRSASGAEAQGDESLQAQLRPLHQPYRCLGIPPPSPIALGMGHALITSAHAGQ